MSRRLRSRAVPAVALAVAAAMMLTGCGPTMGDPAPTPTHLDLSAADVAGTERNGIEYLQGAEALTVAIRAMRSGGAVTVTGDYERFANEDSAIAAGTVHLTFTGTSSRYTANIVADGVAHEIRVAGRTAAVLDGSDPSGTWTCLAADAALVRRWAPLLDPAALAASLLGDGTGLAVSPPRGEPASVELMLGATEGASGSFTVSADGPALPSRLVVADGGGWAEFTFAGWGAEVEVELPGGC